MAIKGIGLEYDVTMDAGASVKTSTSEFLCVGAGPTTTSGDWTAYITNDSTTAGSMNAHHVIGINQTRAMSANSAECSVRMFGISKAICACSVPAFSFIAAYRGASTTTRRGQIEPVGFAQTLTANITSTNFTILGRALQDGSTNSVISVFVNPTPYPFINVTLAAT
jgi:hypothetical protein